MAANQERSFIMIKPDGVHRGLIGEIIKRFEQKGFKLVAMKIMRASKEHLEEHYSDLKAKPFFRGLVEYMASGPVVPMVWEGLNVVKTGRVMLGETNPRDSAPGTIRGDYCIQVGRNICHGSDAVESAKKEIKLWFKDEELTKYDPVASGWVYEDFLPSVNIKMVGGTLYTYPDNFRAFKVLIAAQYSGAAVKVQENFVFGETNTAKDFLAKFPTGKVPAFEATDGTFLTESNAIAYYVANNALRATESLVHSAQVFQWMQYADSDILPASCTWVFPTLGTMQFNKNQTELAKDDVKKAMKVLNDHLLHHTYLVGERISLADIAVACTMLHLYQHVMDPNFRASFGNTNRWFNTMINQPQVKKVIGDFKLCEKMAQFDAKKFDAGKAAGGDKNSKKEGKTTKEEMKPKEKEDPEEPMDDEPKPIKQKDPFETIPKGKFDMDDFKRFYSNNDEAESVPYFWQKFDKENYSIWRCDYKYADELTMVFMSCNLIGGMFQRLDKLRKNAFSSVCLFGENNNSTISGIWVWRGHDLVFELSDDWKIDYSSYNWTKLDSDSAETKALVDQYFKWEGTDKEGRKFNQGKIFK